MLRLHCPTQKAQSYKPPRELFIIVLDLAVRDDTDVKVVLPSLSISLDDTQPCAPNMCELDL